MIRHEAPEPFSPTTLGFLVASVVTIFALSVVLASLDSVDTPIGTTAASPSAIGHEGFVRLLQALDLPVAQSRIEAPVAACGGDLLVVDEPERVPRLDQRGCGGRRPDMLVILPKWVGERDLLHDGWVSQVALIAPDVPRRIFHRFDATARIVRLQAPSALTVGTFGAMPVLDGLVQVATRSQLHPVIGTPDAMLLGEWTADGRHIWILTDSDPIENHAITNPANARFAVALVAAARSGGGGRIVFDEAVHGTNAPERNVLQLLFRFPYVIVTIEGLVALSLLLLATTGRFGGVEVAPPPFALGKLSLIDTTAALMQRAGHQAAILRRYVDVELAETGRALHAPAGLDEGSLAAWLDRIGATRRLPARASEIQATTAAETARPKLLDQARAVYRLKKDLLHDSARRQGRR